MSDILAGLLGALGIIMGLASINKGVAKFANRWPLLFAIFLILIAVLQFFDSKTKDQVIHTLSTDVDSLKSETEKLTRLAKEQNVLASENARKLTDVLSAVNKIGQYDPVSKSILLYQDNRIDAKGGRNIFNNGKVEGDVISDDHSFSSSLVDNKGTIGTLRIGEDIFMAAKTIPLEGIEDSLISYLKEVAEAYGITSKKVTLRAYEGTAGERLILQLRMRLKFYLYHVYVEVEPPSTFRLVGSGAEVGHDSNNELVVFLGNSK